MFWDLQKRRYLACMKRIDANTPPPTCAAPRHQPSFMFFVCVPLLHNAPVRCNVHLPVFLYKNLSTYILNHVARIPRRHTVLQQFCQVRLAL
jgi:hypothetical protein